MNISLIYYRVSGSQPSGFKWLIPMENSVYLIYIYMYVSTKKIAED